MFFLWQNVAFQHQLTIMATVRGEQESTGGVSGVAPKAEQPETGPQPGLDV